MTVAHRIKTPMEVQNIFPTWLCDIHTHFNFHNKQRSFSISRIHSKYYIMQHSVSKAYFVGWGSLHALANSKAMSSEA